MPIVISNDRPDTSRATNDGSKMQAASETLRQPSKSLELSDNSARLTLTQATFFIRGFWQSNGLMKIARLEFRFRFRFRFKFRFQLEFKFGFK